MARFTAFLDACVLVPIAPCDTLLRLADSGAFRPLWSARVVDEALRALERIHPDVDQSRFLSRFRSMDEAFEDAGVEGWESLEQAIDLPDPDDRHVVAAALRGRADAIITENTKDFPPTTLAPLGLEAIRLDDFLLDQYDLNPSVTRRVVAEQAAAMTQPPVELDVLLSKLARSGAREFAKTLGGAGILETKSS
ncbi:putative toxin-antitoxin system toxin component, PIN family [Leucobacter sp. wl10]|uniref:PIN domain-containing protein n=1 Tax=Leucobacter sp. wl10 TaxID=2304677 RepID=UPI000E5B250B|nr:PIN domain-containing protein [Leucobacter sp. wl10]RGE18869.1 PIN domain-containing protein [Leucobacter sp. wl10]